MRCVALLALGLGMAVALPAAAQFAADRHFDAEEMQAARDALRRSHGAGGCS